MTRQPLFIAACAGMFVFGIVLAILGALFGLPEMRARLAIDLAQQGDILLALFFGVFLSTLLSGPMIDTYGNKLVLTVSAAIVTLALASFVGAHAFLPALVTVFVMGFGAGGLNTSSNALVADIYPEDRGAMLNVVGMLFGVGAFFIPLIAGFFGIAQLLLIASAIAAVATIGYATLTFPMPRERIDFSILGSVRAARMPGVLLVACVLGFESGNESAIGGWASTYADSLGAPPSVATWILAGYWAALMFGRLLASRIVRVLTKRQLVIASAFGSVAGCATMLSSRSIPLLATGAAVAGLSFAAIYPTMLAITADRYERAGSIFAFLFAAGLIGGMMFPFAIGHIASSVGIRSGMALPLIGAIAIASMTLTMRDR